MLDISFIKENSNEVYRSLKARNKDSLVDFDQLLVDINKYLEINQKVENHRGLKNKLSKDISILNDVKVKEKLLQEATQLKIELEKLEKDLQEIKNKIDAVVPLIPNIISPNMPIGKGEADNQVLKLWTPDGGYITPLGYKEFFGVDYMPIAPFKYKDHIELGKNLDTIDTEQSSKVSGSRFCYLKGDIVVLQEALSLFMKNELRRRGFVGLIPPVLLKERSLYGTSHFPEGMDQVYRIESSYVEDSNQLYLVGSSEPANFSYFMDRILQKDELPIKIYAQTPSFRSEVGSWGKDVRGIKRVHQFDKLELNAVCLPDQSNQIFEEFLSINEWFYQSLRLTYRVVNKCSGDCGYNASNFQYDIEVWRPSEREFMEVASNTITTDYQSRTLNIRYRENNKLQFVHTVNDTGIPFGRVLIAILENYQQEDGSVLVPDVLQKYTEFDRISIK